MASLDETLAEAFACFEAGVADPASPFRLPTLSTVAPDGAPDSRAVVLRAIDVAGRRLDLHTDARSEKCRQMQANPAVALHVWDAARRLQVRLLGQATLHSGDAVARSAWGALSPLGRQLYRVRQAPGGVIDDPARLDELPEAAGFAVFVVVAVAITRVETLSLADHRQTRARFEWPGGVVRGEWLAP